MTIGAGKVIGKRYQILSELGVGGFGKTFLAVDLYLPNSNRCVVKQLHPDFDDDFTLETARRLFQKEAEILQQLGIHFQIPQLFAYFEEDERFYLVQEYIEGGELASELSYRDDRQVIRQQYHETQTITLLQEILSVLQFIHQNNVIHRDLNPHNLIRRHNDNKLVIIDFGAVKQITSQTTLNRQAGNPKKVTVSIGTQGYLPSEQANGNPRFSSDIYAVGIIGIRVLTGCLVEELQINPQTGEIDWQHLIDKKQKISSQFKNFLDTAISYDYRQRYPSAKEALQALQKIQDSKYNSRPLANATVAFVRNSSVSKIFVNKFKLIAIFFTTIILTTGGHTIFDRLKQQYTNQELYRQANALYDLKRYQEAYTIYERVLQKQPNNSEAIRGKADTLYKLNRYSDALINYEKAIQIKQKDWNAWLGRARSQIKLNKETEAIETLKNITTNEPSNYSAWGELAELYLQKGKYAEAINPLNRTIRANGIDPDLRYQKGWVLYNLKQYREAKESYEDAIELKPDYSQAWYQKGNTLVRLEKYDDAIESYDKAVEFNPKYISAWYAKANTLKTTKKYSEALAAYTQINAIEPTYWQAWYERGLILHQLQQYEEAITSFNRAIKINSNNTSIWYNRGNSAYNSGNYTLAIASYQKTLTLKKDFNAARSSLGNSFIKNRQYREAIAIFDQILQDNPDDRQIRERKIQAKKFLQETLPKETENSESPV
jgi:tetratricopeptide (TPR) repeat protein